MVSDSGTVTYSGVPIRHYHRPLTIFIRNDDGSFTLEVALPDGEWIYGYILSFGAWVEVLEPEHVRKSIAERMRQGLKIYESLF